MNYDLSYKVRRECGGAWVSKALRQITADFIGSQSSGCDEARNGF